MIRSEIADIRLVSQQLTGTKLTTPKEIVEWMVAMQAQDYPMAKWAVGVRLPGSTDGDIEASIDSGSIIRTHLLRPTWHFVAGEDVAWLIDLTRTQIKAAQRSRDRQLELTEEEYTKSNTIIEKALSTGVHLSREELLRELNKANIATDQNRSAHLLARAELEKIICSGATRNNKPTYALFSQRVPQAKKLTREEALSQLARGYFASRCPATLQDFTWWSGLPAGEARQALELVKMEFNPETIDGKTYWLTVDFSISQSNLASVLFLPTYYEFMLSYTDRSASIPAELESHMREISDRGVFRSIIVVNGQVVGIWKKTIKKEQILLELQYFIQQDNHTLQMVEKASLQYKNFTGKKIMIQV
jgi:DNA glycosylase AlkZ-like